MSTTDPFEDLAAPLERQQPRPSFARELRRRIRRDLGLGDEHRPTVHLPERKRAMSTIAQPSTPVASGATPYLTVHDAAAAIDFYVAAFGAVEQMRVVGDDGRVGHADLTIGTVTVFLADEYPEMGIVSPHTLGGSGAGVMLHVTEVDALFARAVDAGATAQRPPEDQPHGNRSGTVVDPFGHRWMLSQNVEDVDTATYADRLGDTDFHVEGRIDHREDIPGSENQIIPVADRPGTGGGIWAAVHPTEPLALIDSLVDVFGFERQIVVLDDTGEVVVHSQLRWPEGGIVQVGTVDPANPFSGEPGTQSLYVVTADPDGVWERSQAAGFEVVREPQEPDHAPGTMGFSVRDPDGNIWSFGQYGMGV